jgi:dephospho-CoA kinase
MVVLRIQVLSGPHADVAAGRLRELDSAGMLAVTVGDQPAAVALVVGIRTDARAARSADVVLDDRQPLVAQADRLWAERLEPFARRMAGSGRAKPGPPALRPHDPRLPDAAQRMLGRIRSGLTSRGLDDGRWTYDHIGSTAVPGLRAKPFIDLQLGAVSVPEEGSPVDDVLAAAGFVPARGARPDSPGVDWDEIRVPGLAPAEAYRKRLYVRYDPGQPAILHVRRLGAPWWSYTVQFRDWLRADPAGRRAYEEMKQRAADAHAGDGDFDGYTRAKTAFFDRVQAAYERTAPQHDAPARPVPRPGGRDG